MRRSRQALVASVLLIGALAGCASTAADVAGASGPRLTPVTAASDEVTYSFFFDDGEGTRMEGTGSFRDGASPVTKIRFDELDVEGEGMRGITYLRAQDRIFTRYDDLIHMLPHMANRWIEVSEAQVGPEGDYLWVFFAEAGMADPRQQRAMLEAASATVVGSEAVEGVPTTHWTSTPSINDLRASELSPSLLEAIDDPSVGGDPDGVAKLDAWVDAEGRVRRFELTGLGEEAGLAIRTTSSFDVSKISEFGLPGNADVVDYDSFKRLGRLGSKIGAGRATAAEVREFAELRRQLRLDGTARPTPVRAT